MPFLGGGSGGGTVVSTGITDSTATGRSVLTAADAAAGRTALGLTEVNDFAVVELIAYRPTTDVATGDGKIGFRVDSRMDGWNLVEAKACVTTAGTTNTTDVQIRRVRSGASADMLTAKIRIDSAEVDTNSAGNAVTIDTTNDDVNEGDQVYVDIDQVSTTAPKGLIVALKFQAP